MNALVFPGQGSQKAGMAKTMCERFPWAAAMARETDRILGRELSALCFNGPEDVLKDTVNTQPALFFTSAVMAEGLKREGFVWQGVAGHSLGEYSALYAAGVASYEELLRLVDLRARAMKEACPPGQGAMAAILMLDRAVVEDVCREVSTEGVCVPANVNCPGQIVISGAAPAVKKAIELAAARGARRSTLLEVSGPFHSPLMQPARDRLAVALESVDFRPATVPVFANVDAQPTTDPRELKRKLLDQLTGTVRWEDCIQSMWKKGFRSFVETGSGKVLAGLIKKIAPEALIGNVQDPDTLAGVLQKESAPG